MDRLQHGIARVRERLERLESDGVVDRYVIQQMRTSAEPEREVEGVDRPWRKDGKRLPVVHRAVVQFWAGFIDFEELAAWVGRSATEDGYLVNGLTWQLKKESRLAAEREVRQEAVRQAKVRAQDYADALDLGPVSVRSINDVGVGTERPLAMQASAPVADMAYSSPDLAFDPDDITISAEVEAEFTVGS